MEGREGDRGFAAQFPLLSFEAHRAGELELALVKRKENFGSKKRGAGHMKNVQSSQSPSRGPAACEELRPFVYRHRHRLQGKKAGRAVLGDERPSGVGLNPCCFAPKDTKLQSVEQFKLTQGRQEHRRIKAIDFS